tara:strand:+ start:19 stop:858 length:840 start_codon:yes stop_codon:yes gene_type:complete
MARSLLERLQEFGGLLQKDFGNIQNQTGGILSNIPQSAILGSAIYGQGVQGRDPFTALLPAATQTAQLQKLMTPKEMVRKTRTLNEEEVKNKGFPAGSIVQEKSDGTLNVVIKPSAKQMEQRTNLQGTIGLLNKIELNYNKAGKPVGKFYNIDPQRLKGEIGKFTGSEQGKTFATLQADIKKATVFLTKAISGAQVSDKEREFIEKLIPSIGDTEVQFEAKLKSLRSYLGDAAKRYGGDVEAMMKAGISAEDYLSTNKSSKNIEKMTDEELNEMLKLYD